MTPDLALRPSKTSLSTLRTSIVQTYVNVQLFLSFAIKQQQRGKLQVATAAFKVGDAENHINELSKCEKMLMQASGTCERHCNLSNRSAVRELLSLKADISKIFQDRMYVFDMPCDSLSLIDLLVNHLWTGSRGMSMLDCWSGFLLYRMGSTTTGSRRIEQRTRVNGCSDTGNFASGKIPTCQQYYGFKAFVSTKPVLLHFMKLTLASWSW